MKKIISLVVIAIISFFLNKGIIQAKQVLYDIHSLRATEQKIIIEGWAFLRDTNHGNNYNTHHTLIFTKVPTSGSGGAESFTVGSRGAQYIDLTCTMFLNPTMDPLCWQILAKHKNFAGLTGIPGVDALVAASQNNYEGTSYKLNTNQKYYKKVGFRFEVNHDLFNPNKCLDYFEEIEYTMKIQVNSDNSVGTTGPINVFAHRISGDYADKITAHASPREMKIYVTRGWVRTSLTTTLDSRISCGGSKSAYFAAKEYEISGHEKYLGDIGGVPDVYKVNYYPTYIKSVGTCLYGPSKWWEQGARLGWAPATWILPVPGPANFVTIPICECDPEKEDCEETDRTIDLECLQGENKKIVPPAIYKIEVDNSACKIGCTEKMTINLPPQPSELKAGTGFAQDIEIKTEKFCSYKWRNKNSPDVKACNEWDVYNNNLNKITPRLEFNMLDNKVSFGEFHKLNYGYEVEEIPLQKPRANRVYGGYIFTFKLPRVYIEKMTGKKVIVTPPAEAPSSETHYDGGHKFYTELDTPTGAYNYKITVTNLGDYNEKQTINYTCCFKVENEFPGPSDPDHYRGNAYIFRPISLENPFPSRSPGANWEKVNWREILSPRLKGAPVYSESNLICSIDLNRDFIKDIRIYNTEHGYLDVSVDGYDEDYFFQKFPFVIDRERIRSFDNID
ncbi:MAG: hypothetical protein WC267_03515, partial [Bacilli bacterium]